MNSQATRYGARLSVEAASAGKAVEVATRHFRLAARSAGLPAWPVARAEAVTEAELESELAAPSYPKLMGVAEVAAALGTSRQRVSALARQRRDLPPPVAELASAPVWSTATLYGFIDVDRRPAQAAKAKGAMG